MPKFNSKLNYFQTHFTLISKLMSPSFNYLIAVQTGRGDGVVGRRQRGQCVDIPEEDGLVQPGRGHLLSVPGVGQRFDIVLVSSQCRHA